MPLVLDGPLIFCLALAATNFGALNSWRLQWRALIGAKGITPANEIVDGWAERKTQLELSWGLLATPAKLTEVILAAWKKFDKHRSLFAFTGATDAGIQAVFCLGFLGVLLIASGYGLLPALGAFFFYLSYTSMHSVAKSWLRLQMDTALPECNLIFAVLFALSWASPSAWIFAQRFLVFRVMLACGVAKWTGGDVTWRNAFAKGKKTAMHYHHLTQPLPGPLARWAHLRPDWYHRVETVETFLFEGPLPLLYFFSSSTVRQIAFFLTAAAMGGIALTGNFGHLHLVTVTEAVAVATEMACGGSHATVTGEKSLLPLLIFENPCPAGGGLVYTALQWSFALIAWGLALGYILLSLPPLFRTFDGLVSVNETVPGWDFVEHWSSRLSRFELFHYASKFTHMTKARAELVIEVVLKDGDKKIWWQLETLVKPGGGEASLSKSPPQMNPLWHARHLWEWHQFFLTNAALRCLARGLPLSAVAEDWYLLGLKQLLIANPDAWGQLVKLPPGLKGSPAKDDIVAVRASLYSYDFTPYKSDDATASAAASSSSAAPAPALTTPISPKKASAAKRASSPSPAAAKPQRDVAPLPSAPASSNVAKPPDIGSCSVDGIFPAKQVGSVWTRHRYCTFSVWVKKGTRLTPAEIRGFAGSTGENAFPRAEPIVLVEDEDSADDDDDASAGGRGEDDDQEEEENND